MFDSVKTTSAYRLYRQSLVYDTVRKHGKVLKRAIKLPRYLGTEYQCPVCGVGLRAFRPMWKSFWREVELYQPVHAAESMETLNLEAFTCPRCDAFDRDRLTAIYLEDAFRSFDRNRTYRLLEFAPGDALYKKLKSHPFIAYRSADLSRKTVDERVDMTDMAAYPDGSLDIVLCSHILEHILEDRKAMRELRRVLKPDGFAIVLVPLVVGVDETHEDPSMNTPALRRKYFGAGDHVRQYGKRDFIERLESSGLTVEQLDIEHFGAETFRRAAIAENSVLYVVRPR
jgi:SAM-dependent methyltransferase